MNGLTVAELIEILKEMPQNLKVQMSMNLEYQCDVEAGMVNIEEYNGKQYVCINDASDYILQDGKQ